MDKKDFENFSEQELEDLKDSIQDEIEFLKNRKINMPMNIAIKYSITLQNIYIAKLVLLKLSRQ